MIDWLIWRQQTINKTQSKIQFKSVKFAIQQQNTNYSTGLESMRSAPSENTLIVQAWSKRWPFIPIIKFTLMVVMEYIYMEIMGFDLFKQDSRLQHTGRCFIKAGKLSKICASWLNESQPRSPIIRPGLIAHRTIFLFCKLSFLSFVFINIKAIPFQL